MTRSVRRAAAAGLLVLVVLAGGCSGDDSKSSTVPKSPASSETTAAPTVHTDVSFGEVTGRLPRESRGRLASKVRGVVDGWLDAAYVAGEYPRSSFADSWPGFTPDARAAARHDRDLTSNADIGDRIDAVGVRRRKLVIDVLAVRHRPVGVTAHVALGFRTTGQTRKHFVVRGRLYLTHTERGWRVFGYDLAKDDGTAPPKKKRAGKGGSR